MAIEYKEVPHEVLAIAQELIDQYHEQLKECKIGFVFRSEASISGGKMVLGTTGKVTEKIKPLLSDELDILIVLAEDQYALMNSLRRKALIDHELCHIVNNLNTGGWTTKAHDINEFKEIVERYGLWSYDLMNIGEAVAKAYQLEMPAITEVTFEHKGQVVTLNAESRRKLEKTLEGG
ncbi:MAG: hypothetical protein A2W25_05055 [candidate division Zixibacteria bacterium RBG_16_53_22]|nr:MAG: hypothetical protein A2W25_05055 [candidate division Zixibacteria bacterium RBG_16_53_22]